MNVLNVRYDVYGGVPDDLARSSITISRRFGTSRSVFRTRGSLYRIYGLQLDYSKWAIAA